MFHIFKSSKLFFHFILIMSTKQLKVYREIILDIRQLCCIVTGILKKDTKVSSVMFKSATEKSLNLGEKCPMSHYVEKDT